MHFEPLETTAGYSDRPGGVLWGVCHEGAGDLICDITCDDGEKFANLFAAAPVMYNALREAFHVLAEGIAASDDARKAAGAMIFDAMAKARGADNG